MFLDAHEVAARYGISLSTVKRWTRAGLLPAPIRLGRRVVRWRLSDLQNMEGQQYEKDRAATA